MTTMEPIIAKVPMTSLNNTKATSSLRNGGNADVESKKAPHEQPHYYSLKDNIKLRYECLMKSKAPIYLFILFYMFICIFGNVVTGIFILKHHFTENEIESNATIINKQQDNSSCNGFCNINSALISNLTSGKEDDLRYLLAYDDLELNMSHFNHFHVELEVRNQL